MCSRIIIYEAITVFTDKTIPGTAVTLEEWNYVQMSMLAEV
jgi:hypothetical protein